MDPVVLLFAAFFALGALLSLGDIFFGRSRRNRISSLPGESTQSVEIHMEIEPTDANGSRWQWHAYFIIDGRPGPFEGHHARGEVRDEATAWETARACADDARARYAAEQVRLGKKRSDRLPL